MLKIFYLNIYALLYHDTTVSFVTPLVARKFDSLTNFLHEHFIVSTLVGESLIAKMVYRNCSIIFPNRVSYVDLVKLDMLDFYIILGMDRVHECFASINCTTRVVRFNFVINPLLSERGQFLFLEVVLLLV